MSQLKICPMCGNVVGFNSHFQAYYCSDCGHLWHEQKIEKGKQTMTINENNITADIFRKCDCETDELPEIFEDGVARRRVYPEGSIYLTESDGYTVECPECGSSTKYHRKIEDAIEAWNNRNLAYDGN